MELRTFGETGLKVSPIGLGMAALGRPGYINLGHAHDYDVDTMEQRAHQVLDAAWGCGIRYFDAARSYGLGEKFLSTWLNSRAVSRDSVTVGSKWGYTYTADWRIEARAHEVKEHSLATLERQYPESLALLDGYLRIYQIHSATAESGVLENGPVLQKLGQLKSDGVRIGLTLSGPSQSETLRRAMETEIDGSRLFDSVQATWNLLEPSAGSALAEAHAAGIGVIIKEALANGRLTDRNQEPDFASTLEVLRTESRELGTTTDALALAVCLSQPFVDVVLSGAANTEQLLWNVQACQLLLDQAILARLLRLAEPPSVYWTTRSKLVWN
ncbi:MAG TPA: aldo/keto reductase [Chthoniobacterales bacterium]|nr:aldo/keto reductase [Chthoniobacterales bacterium]